MSRQRPKEITSGTVEVDFAALTAVCAEQGKWVEDVLKKLDMWPRTKERIRKGLPIRRVTLDELSTPIGPQNLGRILKHAASPATQNPNGVNQQSTGGHIGNWTDAQALTPWITASNGLQYQVSKVRHRHMTDTFARAKCYELKFLSDEERERRREHLERHPQVCRRLAPSLRIPINEDAFPDAFGNWWVIDYWVDGNFLSDLLASEQLALPEVLRIGRELAEGLKLLHDNGIVRRELSPKYVLLRTSDRSVMLTDFELAKLLSGRPTVAKGWPADPYRAPEVGEGEAATTADIYSWGRIMTYMALGVLPAMDREKKSLQGSDLPESLIDLLVHCVAVSPRSRPGTIQKVLEVLSTLR